jgi:hypothetical protein
MLGTKRPDRHALLLFTSLMTGRDAFPPARAGSFFGASLSFDNGAANVA